jgi:hypothetical protein
MGKYAIKQPNGLYCYYSDSFHQIWAYNMNIEQLIAYNAKTWGKTLTQAKEDVLWMLENHIYDYQEMLEDWSWHDDEIEVQMNADPSVVEPCYLEQ